MTDILVISLGPVGSRMAAPGIRALNMARVLQDQVPGARVTLAIPPGDVSDVDRASLPFAITQATGGELARLAMRNDVIVSGQLPTGLLPAAMRGRFVLDMYSPLVTEWASMFRWVGKRHRRAQLEAKRKHLMMELTAADLVLCANERQRDFVAGIMGTHGMITARQFENDPTLCSRIAVAPLGIRPHEPVRRANVMRGVRPGFGQDDLILLWNGTIIEWYDVETLLRAVALVSGTQPDVKLVFLGTAYPQAKEGFESKSIGAGAVTDAMALAEELGILDKHVFFNHGWADAATTEQHLIESDIGVSTYFDNLETHFSFRVRYLDLLWASLPIICTQGDVVSELVAERNLGAAVPAKDVEALAGAILRLGDAAARDVCRRNLDVMREEYRWERTLAPVIDFCSALPPRGPEKRDRYLPLAYRSLDWAISEAHEKLRFAYRKKLMGRGYTGME